MKIFLISTFLLLITSCKAQNNYNLKSEIISFFKVNNEDIQNCKKESGDLRENKFDEITIKTIQDACTAKYDHLNFYRDNTLKLLEKTSSGKDFLIINYISDNSYVPYTTKTILKIDDNYYGLKHYFEDQNDQFVDKNEEFEADKSDIENIQRIEEYLKTGKSEYVRDKIGSLIGNNTHWYVIKKNDEKIKMMELYKIK